MARSYFGVRDKINRNSIAYKLYEKAKKFGVWNPADIDFTQDKEDWKTLTEEQREEVTILLAYFIGGEEAVTSDILPLISTCANKGWIEEELYLTTFVWEEGKHVDFFRTVMDELNIKRDLSSVVKEGHHKLFGATQTTMSRLKYDQSNEAILDACTTYNLFTEGVQAESTYWFFEQALTKTNKMPGLLEGVRKIKQDESRHIAFGTYMLQRLISEQPELLDRALKLISSYKYITEQISNEFILNDSWGVTAEDVVAFADTQFKARLNILEKAKTQSLDEIFNTKESEIVI